MARHLRDIIADHSVTEAELDQLFGRYDANSDGKLSLEELRAFARDVSGLVGGDIEDILGVLDFYQEDDDASFNREELRGFLEIHVA